MKPIIIMLALALSACASRDCLTESRAAVPTYANSVGDMVAATEVEQRCLAR